VNNEPRERLRNIAINTTLLCLSLLSSYRLTHCLFDGELAILKRRFARNPHLYNSD
jgi:hypothetical protein